MAEKTIINRKQFNQDISNIKVVTISFMNVVWEMACLDSSPTEKDQDVIAYHRIQKCLNISVKHYCNGKYKHKSCMYNTQFCNYSTKIGQGLA